MICSIQIKLGRLNCRRPAMSVAGQLAGNLIAYFSSKLIQSIHHTGFILLPYPSALNTVVYFIKPSI